MTSAKLLPCEMSSRIQTLRLQGRSAPMPTPIVPAADGPQSLVALVVTRAGQIALLVAGPDRWREASGYTLVPADLPGGQTLPKVSHADAVCTIAQQSLGCTGRILSSTALYGRTARHAIDRLDPAPGESPYLPVLRLDRLVPDEASTVASLTAVHLSVYLTELDGHPALASGFAGLLWLAPPALRLALRGMPLSDLLALPGITLERASAIKLPPDAFVYVPGDFGERQLLRVAAKYGRAAPFQVTVT
jgi:hypothetical protein